MNEPSMGCSLVPLLWFIASRKKPVALLFSVEPKQSAHWNHVEPIVWRASEEMHYRKYMKSYRMSLEAFDNLVQMLTPYLQSQCINLVRSQLEIKKILALVLYRFVHGVSPNPYISNCFQAGGSIVRKYVDLICDVLTSRVEAHYTPYTFRQPFVPFLYPLYQGFRMGFIFCSILAVLSIIVNGRLGVAWTYFWRL